MQTKGKAKIKMIVTDVKWDKNVYMCQLTAKKCSSYIVFLSYSSPNI